MKKIFLLAVILITGFTLTGCDLIPKDIIDQVSEDLCREDPTNELCTIDNLSTVTDAVAEQMVLDAITTINGDGTVACDTVFSITNTTLLDSCKDGSLLPEGVTSFTVISSEKNGDVYVFKGSTTEDDFLEIRVTFGEIDGNMRVTSFETSVIDDPTDNTVCTEDCTEDITLAEFETFFKQFIDDYLDSTITSADLINTYFSEAPDMEFATDRDKDLTEGTMITYVSAKLLEDGLFEVTLNMGTTTEPKSETVNIRVNRIEMALKLSFDGKDDDCDGMVDECMNNDMLTNEEVILLLQSYFTDYTDNSITDQQFADMYLDGMVDEGFTMMRRKDINDGAVIELLNVVFHEDGSFEAEYAVTVAQERYIRKRPGRTHYKTSNTAYIMWEDMKDENVELDPTKVSDMFNQFITDYLDSTISDTELQGMYFGDMNMTWFIENRQMDLDSGIQISSGDVILYDESGFFMVNLTITEGEDTFEASVVIKVMKRIDQTTPLLYIMNPDGEDNDCDLIGDTCEVVMDAAMAASYMTEFLTQYNNKDVPDEAIMMYFLDYFSMLNQRSMDITEGIIWVLEPNVEPLENNYFLFHLTAQTEKGEIQRDITARVYHLGSMAYFRERGIDPNDCVLTVNVCHFMTLQENSQMVEGMVRSFLDDFVNPDITFDLINEKYFMNNAPEFLKIHFDQNNSLGATVNFESITPNADHPGFFDVTYTMVTSTSSVRHNITIILWLVGDRPLLEFYDENNPCHSDPYSCSMMMDMFEKDLTVISSFLEHAFVLLNDSTVTNDMIQSDLFGWMAPESILRYRESTTNVAVFTFQSVTAPEDMMTNPFFTVTFTIDIAGQEQITEMWNVQFLKTEMGLLIIPEPDMTQTN